MDCQWTLVNWEVNQCGCPLLGSVGLESEAHLVSDWDACCSLWAKHGQIGSNKGQTESEHHDSLGWQARGRANCLGVPGESVGECHHDCQDGNVAIWGVWAAAWTLQQRGCGREWVCQNWLCDQPSCNHHQASSFVEPSWLGELWVRHFCVAFRPPLHFWTWCVDQPWRQ